VGSENNTSMTRAERVLEGEVLAPETEESRAVEGVVGIVPLFVDPFDAACKANVHATRRASRLFLARFG
jgi:hypothetical protein